MFRFRFLKKCITVFILIPGSFDSAPCLANQNVGGAINNISWQTSLSDSTQDTTQLLDIADSLLENGNIAAALDTYRKAQHFIHMDSGVHSIDQIPILNKISSLYLGQGDRFAANREQDLAFMVATRDDDQPIEERVSAYEKLAQYHLQQGNFSRVFKIYDEEIAYLEAREDADPAIFFQPLKGIADTAIRSGYRLRRAIDALDKLSLKLDNTASNKIDRVDQLTVQIQLADLHLLRADYKTAEALYKSIWKNTEDTALLEPFFSEPTLLYPTGIRTPFLYEPGSSKYVDISVNVNTEGKISDVNIANRNLTLLQRGKILLWFRYNRYRPKMIDGEIVPSEGLNIENILASEFDNQATTALANTERRID